MKINFNMSAIISNDYLARSESALSKSTERLSSGYKLNHAKDDPSGIAISKKMHAQIRGLSRASQNASDGISIIETAEGALAEVQDMLQRLNELSIKSANGTMSDNDRAIVQEEADALLEEINRIAETTEFNGSTLLDGTYDLKGYVEGIHTFMSDVTVESYSDDAKVGYYRVELENVPDGEGGSFIKNAKILLDEDTIEVDGREVPVQKVQNQKATVADDGKTITIEADNGFSLTLVADLMTPNAWEPVYNVYLTGIGPMTVQIGANEGQTLDIRIPTVSTKTLGIEELDVSSSQDVARKSIDKISDAISTISSIRSRLGAYQNRLEHTISSLDVTEENMTAAYSRIIDVDMAEEMTEYTSDQILSQAGTSILAQANERPSQVLQLLQ